MSVRAVKKTPAGLEYQIDLLGKEVKRLRKNLTNQIGGFDELIQTCEASRVQQELDKLKRTFTELCEVSTRLCLLFSKEDETQEEKGLQEEQEIRRDAENVERIQRAVEEWLEAKGDGVRLDDKRSNHSAKTIRSSCRSKEMKRKANQDNQKERIKEDSMSPMIRLMRKCSRLENQAAICDDLLMVNDAVLLKKSKKVEATA